MSRQAELAQLGRVFDSGPLSNRNLIINGAMQVAQRGTSFSSAGYTLDRWTVGSSGYNISQSTDVPSGQGFTYSLSSTRPSATSHFITTTVELPATGKAGVFYNGNKLTLSAWVKGVSGSEIAATLRFRIGSSGTAGTNFSRTQSNITLTGDWQYIVFDFDVDQDVGASDTALHMFWSYNGQATNETFYFTGVQLEVGDVATPFEHRSYGQELALCQRYFELVAPPYNQTHAIYFDGSTVVGMHFPFAVPKRASPTCTLTSDTKNFVNYGGGNIVTASSAFVTNNATFYQYRFSGSGLSAGPVMNLGNMSFTADAEL